MRLATFSLLFIWHRFYPGFVLGFRQIVRRIYFKINPPRHRLKSEDKSRIKTVPIYVSAKTSKNLPKSD